MKIKQWLVIANPAEFMRGSRGCFTLCGHDTNVEGWINCGPIEIEVDVDVCHVHDVAIREIDSEITRNKAVIEMLERAKGELLAITQESAA